MEKTKNFIEITTAYIWTIIVYWGQEWDEKAQRTTRKQNGIGFNYFDAGPLTEYAEKALQGIQLSIDEERHMLFAVKKYRKQCEGREFGFEWVDSPAKAGLDENSNILRVFKTHRAYGEARPESTKTSEKQSTEQKSFHPRDPRIELQGNALVAYNSYAIKDVLKSSGFRWNATDKVWVSSVSTQTKNEKIHQYMTDEAIYAVDGEKIKREEAIKASSQASEDGIELECPEDKNYLPFQEVGISEAVSRGNAIIADEMGLGKTIQAIGYINNTDTNTALIVVPASLKRNWKREVEKWLVKDLTVDVITKKMAVSEYPQIAIVNYESINADEIVKRNWDLLILDEAHKIKNTQAQRTKTIQAIAMNFKNRLALTGTPILNRPVELWSLLELVKAPIAKDGFWKFAFKYCDPSKNKWGGWEFGSSHRDQLQEELRASVLIRRLKKDVLKELPAKVRSVVELEPNASAKKLIDKVKAELGDVKNPMDAFKQLRQLGEDSESESNVFRVMHQISLLKVKQTVEFVNELLETQDKVVVFCQHQDVVDGIVIGLGDMAVSYSGAMSEKARDLASDSFQNGDKRVIVATMQSAGVGLTWTAAQTAVFVQLDWTPAMIEQAEDRIHRIGQIGSVNIYYLVYPDTLDAYMGGVMVNKHDVITEILNVG